MATLGYIKDGVKGQVNLMPNSYPAEKVSYDNTDSGLTATDIQDAIDELAGGSGGHVIENSSGTDLPQEDTLQFADSHVTDDSTNSKTVVETFKAVTQSEYASETEDGAYIITDGDGAVIEPASEDYVEVDVTTSMTYGDALALLFNDVDLTKVTENSYINMLGFVFYLTNNETGNYDFTSLNGSSSKAEMFVINNYNNVLKYYVYNLYTQQRTDKSSDNIWTNGKIKLYYGNKKAIVDLQTTANRCWYDSNNTVKQKIDDLDTNIVYLAHSNSTTGRAFAIDTSAYKGFIVTLFKNNAAFATVISIKAQMISFTSPHITLVGKYSGTEYDGDVQFSSDIKQLQQIIVSNNSVICTVWGIKR